MAQRLSIDRCRHVSHDCQPSHLISAAEAARHGSSRHEWRVFSRLTLAQQPTDCHNLLSKTARLAGNRLYGSAPQGIGPNHQRRCVAVESIRQFLLLLLLLLLLQHDVTSSVTYSDLHSRNIHALSVSFAATSFVIFYLFILHIRCV